MWAVINKENKVTATINVKPSLEDLTSRGEVAVQCDDTILPGMIYKGSSFTEGESSNVQ